MNAKKSWILFGALWLGLIVLIFAHASKTVEVNLQNGLIWFGIFLIVACGGVFAGVKLNKKK